MPRPGNQILAAPPQVGPGDSDAHSQNADAFVVDFPLGVGIHQDESDAGAGAGPLDAGNHRISDPLLVMQFSRALNQYAYFPGTHTIQGRMDEDRHSQAKPSLDRSAYPGSLEFPDVHADCFRPPIKQTTDKAHHAGVCTITRPEPAVR